LQKKYLIKKIIDAHLWIKKYLTEFSNSIFNPEEIIGRKLNILIPNLIHMKSLGLNLKHIITDVNIKK